ncbi:MAG: DMT family transporter [Anaerolineales bacterium]|nr:MAG: DMT family transporter [Anaerolineales bacterium]
MTAQKKTYLALVLITILWGNSFVAMKHAVQFLTPVELTILRFIPVAVAFAALLLPTRRVSFWAMVRKEWPLLILLGLTGAVGYNIFVMTGSQRIAAGTTSLIVPSLNPVLTFILSIIFLKERPTVKKGTGLILASIGLYIIVRYSSGERIVLSYLLYVFVTMLAPLCFAIYTIVGKPLVARYPPLQVTGGAMMAAVIPLLFLIDGDLIAKLPTLPATVWLSIAFLSFLCTVFAFVVWFWALQKMEASRVGSFTYLVPLFGVSFSQVILGESITLALIIGGAILLSGVYIINRP